VTVRKAWTARQAWAAQERFLAAGGGFADPTGPFSQWAALHRLDDLEAAYRAGDEGALLAAVRDCACHQLVMPDWLVRAFVGRYDKVLTCRVGSWDDAFGRPFPKGRSLAAARKRRAKRFAVVLAVRRLHQQGRAIDEGLFAEAGQALAISGATARDLYYETLRRFPYLATSTKKPKPL
jgi:hypothetical protein